MRSDAPNPCPRKAALARERAPKRATSESGRCSRAPPSPRLPLVRGRPAPSLPRSTCTGTGRRGACSRGSGCRSIDRPSSSSGKARARSARRTRGRSRSRAPPPAEIRDGPATPPAADGHVLAEDERGEGYAEGEGEKGVHGAPRARASFFFARACARASRAGGGGSAHRVQSVCVLSAHPQPSGQPQRSVQPHSRQTPPSGMA